MTDDGFHLTPLDVRTQEFEKALRGYNPAGVEEFRERVAAELERLIRENAVLEEQVKNFRDQLKTFREREKALSDALVVAQKLRDDVQQSADREAKVVLRDARGQAENIIREARIAEEAVRRDIEAGHKQLAGYLASFRVLLERNLAELEAVESREREDEPLEFQFPRADNE